MTARPAPWALLLAAALLHLVLIQPNHPGAITWGALRLFPLELPVLLFGLAALPTAGRVTGVVRALLVLWLVPGALLKAADIGMFVAFNRGFNMLLDSPLLLSAWQLGVGSIGLPAALAVAAAAVLALAVFAGGLWWATGTWAGLAQHRWPLAGSAAVLAGLLAGAEAGQAMRLWPLPADPPGAAFTARLTAERVRQVRRSLADLTAFRAEASADPLAGATGLFDQLEGRDVLILFVESYGRSSFAVPLYARTHLPTLRAAEVQIAAAGLAMRSGWVTSPIAGGQSWLAHGTLASGLRLDGQGRYGAMLASGRQTLFHLAAASGYRTAAVMPAITLAWPEGRALGFGEIHAAADMGYRGPAFDWVTMPDQYTLAVTDRLLDRRSGRAPVLAQVVLISSHAPWVPVPRMLPWERVGDGAVFAGQVAGQDTPAVVWRNPGRVRDQYRLALDYALQAALGYAARQTEDAPLIVMLGDHQAAPFVAQHRSRDVPVHLIGPPDLVALTEAWGWTPGLVPGPDAPVWPMAAFRDRFVAAYSSQLPPGATFAPPTLP